MKKFEEEFNYLIELSGKVLTGQIEVEKFEKHRTIFLNKYAEKQQPEIPEFVAEYIKSTADPIHEMCAWSEHYGDNGAKCDDLDLAKMLDWFGTNREIFYKAVVNDYTVEKPKRFHLKNKLTGLYLRSYSGLSMDDTTLRFEEVSDNRACGFSGGTQFTQSEIANMETGSYEQLEVEG